MTVSSGNIVYQHQNNSCSGIGITWTSEELDTAITERVTNLIFDDEGKNDIFKILSNLIDTNFTQENLREILENTNGIENWRVGEAIAEAYLTDHRKCVFPWPDNRDERRGGSSLPGADLVGFQTDGTGNILTFGEVKTSSEIRYPPHTMHGEKGLKKQLKELRDSERIRDDLMIYLCYRSKNTGWKQQFEQACRRYLKNKSDVRLYGMLIRDVEPNENDLNACTQTLANGCPTETKIELLALYLPEGRIKEIGKNVVDLWTRGKT